MSNSGTQEQLVVFSLGREEYALPIARVREIVRYSEPRPSAHSTPWIRGVIALRGRDVPVCDLAARLGVPAAAAKIVIVEGGGAGAGGVIVDDVKEVLTVAAEQLHPASGPAAHLAEAVAEIDGRVVIVLDPDAILDGGVTKAVA